MKKSLIVLSGGMDSVTLLYDYAESMALALSFNYGSKHNEKELAFARLHCERLGIEHLIIDLPFINELFKSSLLISGDDIPEGPYRDENMCRTVVPFRNGIMLSIAAGIAESRNLAEIYIASHSGDHTIYPDCSEEFIESMDAAIGYGTYNNVYIVAPYIEITKTEIALRGKKLGIDYSLTWSCYKGGKQHCGKCGTCIERFEALEEADKLYKNSLLSQHF